MVFRGVENYAKQLALEIEQIEPRGSNKYLQLPATIGNCI